jgi:septum formation protein
MILANAGLEFEVALPEIDERAAERPLVEAGASAVVVALTLAMAKAVVVSEQRPQDLVIGADQTLELGNERLDKPAVLEAARIQLLQLSVRRHNI